MSGTAVKARYRFSKDEVFTRPGEIRGVLRCAVENREQILAMDFPTTIELSGPNNIDPIIVVTAAIVDTDAKRLFVQRRSGKTSYPWHWCTPGGKAGPNEGLWSALFRELAEEHGARANYGLFGGDLWPHMDPVYTHEFTSSRTGQPMRVMCRFIPSSAIIGPYSANAEAVAGFDWVTANELETLMLTPADHANRGKLLDLIR